MSSDATGEQAADDDGHDKDGTGTTDSKRTGGGDDSAVPDDDTGVAEDDALIAEVELLREQNQRLRESYVEAKRTQYRRSALGLGVLGALALVAAVFVAPVRDLLIVLGATGLFAGVLTYYLTPERFLSADVGASVYDVLADDRTTMIAELGLSDERVYIPVGEAPTRIRLFVPQFEDYERPPEEDLEGIHVVTAAERGRGVSFRPTGEPLYDSFDKSRTSTPARTAVATLVPQLTDALVEQFDLARRTQVDIDEDDGRVTVGIADAAYEPIGRFDHPIASFLAVGLARNLDTPVRTDIQNSDRETIDYRITIRWEA